MIKCYHCFQDVAQLAEFSNFQISFGELSIKSMNSKLIVLE